METIKTVLVDYSRHMKKIDIPDIPPETMDRGVICEIRSLFCDVTDFRLSARTKYPIREILLVAFTAVLSGFTDYEEIEAFGNMKLRFFRRFYPFSNGICSHETFLRAISLINTATLQKATVEILDDLMRCIESALQPADKGDAPDSEEEEYRQICVDGKANRGTSRCLGTEKEKRNFQTLNIYDRSTGICLSSSSIPEKTNEIPESQRLLNIMDLNKCIVTFDALNTQKNTCRIIINRKGHYIGGLKGNQPGLLQDAKDSDRQRSITDKRKT